jgi:hypothetical protein
MSSRSISVRRASSPRAACPSDDLRLYDDQLAIVNEGGRESRHRRASDGRFSGSESSSRVSSSMTSEGVPNDTCRDDLGAAKWRMNDVYETDVLVRIPRADLRPRQWLGLERRDVFRSIHASIFPVCVRMSSFLTRDAWANADTAAETRYDRGKTLPPASRSAAVRCTSRCERRARIPPPVLDGPSSKLSSSETRRS